MGSGYSDWDKIQLLRYTPNITLTVANVKDIKEDKATTKDTLE